MKKFIYLCGMMLICMDIMAQIDPYDRNWETVVFDDFDEPNRQFDSTFQEPLRKWISFCPRLHPSGITKRNGSSLFYHQIYQSNHCSIDGDNGVLKLFSDFIGEEPVLCDEQPNYYYLPPHSFGKSFECDQLHDKLYYYSGMVESLPGGYGDTADIIEFDNNNRSLPGRFRYGYFEIRCKLPVHRGAFPAFWLWDAQQDEQYYESIDIMEYSWYFTDSTEYPSHNIGLGSSRYYLNKIDYNQHERCKVFPEIPNGEEDLTGWHTFSCEWLPESVTFYRDGKVTAKEEVYVPSHYLTLKVNYAIDKYAMSGFDSESVPEWRNTDTMYVDYIKVFQLKWDCDTDEIITNQTELDTFNYGVKKSIDITSSQGNVSVGGTDKVTFRVTDTFEVTGPFQTDLGGELTIILQQCPEELTETKQTTPKNSIP